MTNSRMKFAALLCSCCPVLAYAQAAYGPNLASVGNGRPSLSETQSTWSFGPVQVSVILALDGIRDSVRRYYHGISDGGIDTLNASLTFAQDRFFEKGGKYAYGPNDCSTFVCDFLGQFTTTVPRRFTTASLFDHGFMNDHGFIPVEDIYCDAREFDVIVYRYYDIDFNAEGGHCGLVVWKDGKLCVEHNSSSQKGLAWTPIEDFYRRMANMPDLRGPHLFRWAGNPATKPAVPKG